MISHTHKVIFIHIPKCAGTSIYKFFHPNVEMKFDAPNYDILFGYCPKTNLHLQHATPNELISNNLISQEQWDTYYKFAFVRNPWERAYSDYFWMHRTTSIMESFSNFIQKKGKYKSVLTDNTNSAYRGDHLTCQNQFTELNGNDCLDFVGKVENFDNDIQSILNHLDIKTKFDVKVNQGNQHQHYSQFYNKKTKSLVDEIYKEDITKFDYTFDEKFKLKSAFGQFIIKLKTRLFKSA